MRIWFAICIAALPCGAGAQSATPPDDHRITIAQGVSAVMPAGWSSCDATINQQLGGPEVPARYAGVCNDPPPKDMTVQAAKWHADGFTVLLVEMHAGLDTPFNASGTIDSDKLQAGKEEICGMASKLGTVVIGGCDFAVGTVAGKTAVSVKFMTSDGKGVTQALHIVVFPLNGGVTMLLFDRAIIGTPPDNYVEDPDIAAMIASLAVQ